MKRFLLIVLLTLAPFSAYASDPLLDAPCTDDGCPEFNIENPEPKEPRLVLPDPYWAVKPVQCTTVQKMIEMVSKYGEVPTIRFEGMVSTPTQPMSVANYVIAMNPNTLTWTLLEFQTGNDQACILATGKGELIFKSDGIKT